MEADGSADKKTRKHTEGAATAVQSMHGDRFPSSRVDPGPKTNSTSFSVKAKPPALPCRDDVLVENGAAAPKSSLTLRDAHISRRWLTSHGLNLYSNEDQLRLLDYFVLPDRRDAF